MRGFIYRYWLLILLAGLAALSGLLILLGGPQ